MFHPIDEIYRDQEYGLLVDKSIIAQAKKQCANEISERFHDTKVKNSLKNLSLNIFNYIAGENTAKAILFGGANGAIFAYATNQTSILSIASCIFVGILVYLENDIRETLILNSIKKLLDLIGVNYHKTKEEKWKILTNILCTVSHLILNRKDKNHHNNDFYIQKILTECEMEARLKDMEVII